MTGRTAAFAAISAATLIGTCGIFALGTAATAQTGVPLPAPRPSQQQAPAAKPQPPMPLNPGAQQKQQGNVGGGVGQDAGSQVERAGDEHQHDQEERRHRGQHGVGERGAPGRFEVLTRELMHRG